MQVRLSENIRILRKARGLTQEQLADAMRVTVGAVSKWESGLNTPDIGLILELADFFETSVDVLLGYEWRSGSMDKAVERINRLCGEKRFDEGAGEAEKALQKYPNSFDVVYNSGVLYEMKGLERHDSDAMRSALKLYEHAIELLAQNTDDSVGEPTIRRRMADTYLMLGSTELALEQLKKYNYDCCNSSQIGYTLATVCHKPDEALPYLSQALVKATTSLVHTSIAYGNSFLEKDDTEKALEILTWIHSVVSGLLNESAVSYLDKTDAMLLAGIAQINDKLGKYDDARECLRKSLGLARRFDANPDYRAAAIKFYYGKPETTAYDDIGSTVIGGLNEMLYEDKDASERLIAIWDELKREPSADNK